MSLQDYFFWKRADTLEKPAGIHIVLAHRLSAYYNHHMRTIIAEAPMRIDFAGGTLDIPPLYLFHQPALTINIAIDIMALVSAASSEKTVVVSRDQKKSAEWATHNDISWKEHPELELILRALKAFDPKEHLRLEVSSEAPVGSGLGASSSIAIALVAALSRTQGKEFSFAELVEYAKSIETQTIKVPTGYQDYWAAVYGGAHAYEMGLDGRVRVARLGTDAFLTSVEEHMVLAYAGKPHFSGTNNWELYKRHIDGDKATIRFFEELKENALFMKDAFGRGNIGQVADALFRDWRTRKAMLPAMTTPEIETLFKKTLQAGALAGRVCGAGGGGCVLLLVPPEKRAAVNSCIQKIGMRALPAKISKKGVSAKIVSGVKK